MSADTSKLLDNVNLQDISRSYLLAYLQSKGVAHTGVDPVQDNHWNFGAFEEGHLIRTENNSLFIALTCPEIKETDDAAITTQQSVGSNLQERLLDIIAHMIANKIKKLPEKNIEFAFYINHNNGHWTSLLANFEGLNDAQYQALYNAYQKHDKRTNESKDNKGVEKAIDIRRNYIREFIKAQREMILNDTNTQTNEKILSNWVLPLDVKKISLRHFDSLGKNAGYGDSVEKRCSDFVLNHNAEFVHAQSNIQRGMTCGDWSVYNAFRFGALKNRTKAQPSSQNLRLLAENTSVANAHQILFSNKPNLKEVPEGEQIRIQHHAFQYEIEEDPVTSSGGVTEEPTTPDNPTTTNPTTPVVNNNSSLNHSFPITYALIKTAFMACMIYATHMVFPLAIVGFTAYAFALTAISLSSYFLFDVMLQGFFGQMKLSLQLNDQNIPVRKKMTSSGGWGELLGIKAPYHQTLAELEEHLSGLLATKITTPMDDKKLEKHIQLTHTYAKKVINQNPHYFYPEDVKAVNEASYVSASVKP